MNNLNYYILPFLISLVLSFGITKVLIGYLTKNKISLATPRERDIHQKPTPRLGGLALFLSFWLVILFILIVNPNKLDFSGEKILGFDKNLLGVFLGSVILLAVGIADDIRGIKPIPKMIWQLAAATVVVIFGIKIWWLSNPAGGLNIILGNFTYIFVPLWIFLIVNVVNWLDGADGLADGISFITLIVLAILSVTSYVNQPATALICAVLAGASLGFLFFNFNPAKIFLGDSGSMFLGFMIAVAAIISGGKVATVALILGIPILDALWVIARRIFSGKSPMRADKLHLHHRFLGIGLSQRQTVLILYLISATFGIIALQTTTAGKVIASLWLLAAMVIIGAILVIIKVRNIKHKV